MASTEITEALEVAREHVAWLRHRHGRNYSLTECLSVIGRPLSDRFRSRPAYPIRLAILAAEWMLLPKGHHG